MGTTKWTIDPNHSKVTFSVRKLMINAETSLILTISGKVNHRDSGLSWNGKNQAGEIIVGDHIKLKARVSFIQQPAAVEETQNVMA